MFNLTANFMLLRENIMGETCCEPLLDKVATCHVTLLQVQQNLEYFEVFLALLKIHLVVSLLECD